MMSARLAEKEEPIYYGSIAEPIVESGLQRFENYFFIVMVFLAAFVLIYSIWPRYTVYTPVDKKVVVQAYDTIWNIAAKEYPEASTRDAKDAIMQANGIHDAGQLRVGQVLEMPIMK